MDILNLVGKYNNIDSYFGQSFKIVQNILPSPNAIYISQLPANSSNRKLAKSIAKKQLLQDYFKSINIEFDISMLTYTALGKPYIPKYPNIHISLSYSRNFCALVQSSMPIGIDIQDINPRLIKLVTKEKIFTKKERDYILSFNDDSSKTCAFYEIWTKKEAYSKVIGTGINYKANNFDILDVQSNCSNFNFYFCASSIRDVAICVCTSAYKEA